MLIEAALDRIKGEYLVKAQILEKSIEILKGYIGSEDKQDLQLESIFAIQLLSNELEHPSGKHWTNASWNIRTFHQNDPN